MDKLLDKNLNLSSVIPIGNEEIIRINGIVYGIIYYKSYKLFSTKWKKRFFELGNNYLDLWNPKKSHKTCKTIKNINNYTIKSINNRKLYGENGLYLKLINKKKIVNLFSPSDNIKIIINKINEFMIK